VSEENVLVVEDEPDIAELIEYNLLKNGFSVNLAVSGEEALAQAREAPPHLVILDLMLPGVDGLEVCRRLKKDPQTSDVPVIMVTAKGEESDVVTGLELGADDYIVKPFSPKVLVARIKAVLRRGSSGKSAGKEVVSVGALELYPGRREARVEDRPVSLTYTEFNILLLLARRPGWVFTRSQIFHAVRGDRYHVTERSVDVHIRGLRKTLGGAAEYLETVRGVGYRFRG
jgi:two-component system alkaline phosphatase synthesis response regulator PhoP